MRSERYAKALLKYVTETGNGKKVYEQAKHLEGCFSSLEGLRLLVRHPKATSDRYKLRVFVTALGGEKEAAPELVRFLNLVMKNRRIMYVRLMLLIFMDLYRKANNISFGRLVVAVPSEQLQRRLTDSSIIGGFVLDMGWERLDASVASQLRAVRRQFVEKNRRIV